MSDKPQPRIVNDVPRCCDKCPLYWPDDVCSDADEGSTCEPAVRAMARELRETESRALAAEARLRTLDRIRALGNGQVPAVVAGAWEVLHDD